MYSLALLNNQNIKAEKRKAVKVLFKSKFFKAIKDKTGLTKIELKGLIQLFIRDVTTESFS